MQRLLRWFKQLFCRHEWVFWYQYNTTIQPPKCYKCGKFTSAPELISSNEKE